MFEKLVIFYTKKIEYASTSTDKKKENKAFCLSKNGFGFFKKVFDSKFVIWKENY